MPAPFRIDKEDQDAAVNHPRVYLRLRPLSELEVNRRSRCAVQVVGVNSSNIETQDIDGNGTPTVTTVALEDGTSVALDGVMVVPADNTEDNDNGNNVLRDEEQRISQQLVQGHNCTVLAYGCTGTGKTTTMFGESSSSMLQRVTEQLFQELQQPSSSSSLSQILVTCSVVEIYLERIRDLLLPLSGASNPGVVRLVPATTSSLSTTNHRHSLELHGAARLSCLCAADIVAVVQRALAFRMRSFDSALHHSPRSTILVQVQIQQHQQQNHQVVFSQLRFLDLVGSELVHTAANGRSCATTTSGSCAKTSVAATDTLEAAQISVSLKALYQNLHAHQMDPHWPTVTRLVWSSLYTSIHSLVVLTASPSHLSALDTAQTLQFGAECRRMRVVVPSTTTGHSQDIMSLAEQNQLRKQNKQLQHLVRALVRECKNLKPKQRSDNSQLWYMIDQITKQQQQQPRNDNDSLNFCCIDHDTTRELEQLRHDQKSLNHSLESTAAERDQLCSDLAILQAQIVTSEKHVAHYKHRSEQMQREIQNLQQQLRQQQQQCRVSQFREQEAVTFVRQLRRFYARLLEKTAHDGTGMLRRDDGMAQHVPGAPNLTELVDLDRHLLESGLLERHEVMGGAAFVSSSNKNQQTATTQRYPSSEALQTSARQCAKLRQAVAHEEKQATAVKQQKSAQSQQEQEQPPPLAAAVPIVTCAVPGNRADDSSQHRIPVVDGTANLPLSTVHDSGMGCNFRGEQHPEHIEARQRLYQTPAGRFVELREHVLEQELRQLSEANTVLQRQLDEANVNIQALSEKHGMAATLDKMRIAQETRHWKEQLERKNNDLKTVIWKMNELHMVGKTLKAQSEQREQHMAYLEEQLAEAQVKGNVDLAERQRVEERLRNEIVQLQQQIKNDSTPIWHLLGNNSDLSRSVPLAYRLVVPFTTNTNDWAEVVDDPDISTGEPGEWTDLLETYQAAGRCNVGTQTDLGDSFFSAQGITEENVGGLMFMDSPLHVGPRQTVRKMEEDAMNAARTATLFLDADDDDNNNATQRTRSVARAVELESLMFLDDSETGQGEHLRVTLGTDNDFIPNDPSTHPFTNGDNSLQRSSIPDYDDDDDAIDNDVPLYAVDSAASPTLSPISSISVTAMSKATLAIMARTLNLQDVIESPRQQPSAASTESMFKSVSRSQRCEGTGQESKPSCESKRQDSLQCVNQAGIVRSYAVPAVKNGPVETDADEETETTATKSGGMHKDVAEVADACMSIVEPGAGTEPSSQMTVASSANETEDLRPETGIAHYEETAEDEPHSVPADAKWEISNSESADGPSEAKATATITKKKPAEQVKSSFLERLQKQAQKKLAQDSSVGGGGGKPEFMKLFNTIASKNLNEKVVETSGAVAPREATIVSFEQLHLRKTGKGFKPGDDNCFSQGNKKWTPRKAKKDDSDSDSDDSFARNFMSGAQMGHNVRQPKVSTVNSDPDSDHDEPKDSEPPAPAHQPVRRLTLDSDPDSSSREENPANPAASAPTLAPQFERRLTLNSDTESTAAPQANIKLTLDSDGDSDGKSKVSPTKPAQSFSAPLLASKQKPNIESDLESSDDYSKVEKAATSSLAPDSDSDSDSDDQSKAPQPALESPSLIFQPQKRLNHISEQEDSDNGLTADMEEASPPAPESQPARRLTLASDSESDSNDKPTASPVRPAVSASPKPHPERRLTLDSDSDSVSDDESKTFPVSPATSASLKPQPERRLTFDSDSESDYDDESNASPVRPTVSSSNSPPERRLTLDSDSDSDSNDESKSSPVRPTSLPSPVPQSCRRLIFDPHPVGDANDESDVTPAKPSASLTAALSKLDRNRGSDSDSSESDDESKAPAKPAIVSSTSSPLGRNSRNSSWLGQTKESDSESSDEESKAASPERKAAPASVAAPAIPTKKLTLDSESENSDSSDEETRSSNKAPVTQKSESSSDDESTPDIESILPAEANESQNDELSSKDGSKSSKPTATHQTKLSKDESSSSDSSSSAGSSSSEQESSDEESPKAASKCSKPKVAPKPSGSVAKKVKPRFVMKDGKLVKTSGGVQSPTKSSASGSTEKAKFAIKDGKLVSQGSKSKKTDYIIKDGKLTKNDSATSKSSATPKKKKPAFTIVDGKLVKADKDKPTSTKGKKKK